MISPEIDEDGLSKIVAKVTQSISGRGGAVGEVKNWGRRKLAYPVKRFVEADYILTRFKLRSKSVRELENEIGGFGGVLRYLVVKVGD